MHYNILKIDFKFSFSFIFNKYFEKCIKKPVKILNYIYNNYLFNLFFENRVSIPCCEVFVDANAIYFAALRWIMNVWSGFETLKTQLLEKHILIIFLLWKWIKYIFVLFVLTICIKKIPGVRSIAMKSIRTTILTS